MRKRLYYGPQPFLYYFFLQQKSCNKSALREITRRASESEIVRSEYGGGGEGGSFEVLEIG